MNRGLPVLELARSRFLVLTERSAATGDENAAKGERKNRTECPKEANLLMLAVVCTTEGICCRTYIEHFASVSCIVQKPNELFELKR